MASDNPYDAVPLDEPNHYDQIPLEGTMSASPTVAAEPGMSRTEAARIGLTHLLGLRDPVSGLQAAAEQGLAHLSGDRGLTDSEGNTLGLMDSYRSGRDDSRQERLRANDQHPWISGISSAIGDAPFMALAPEALASSPVGMGATLGAVQGAGESQGDLTRGQYGQVAADATMGGALGGALGKATELLTPSAMRAGAGKMALASVGAKKSTLVGLGLAKSEDVARDLVDSGVVPLSNSRDQLAKNLAQKVGDYEGEVNDIILKAGDFDMKPFLSKALKLYRDTRADPAKAAQAAKLRSLIMGYADESEKRGGISMAGANAFKQTLWKTISNFKDDPFAQSAQRDLGQLFKGEIEDQVGAKLGQGVKARLQDANRRWGSMIEGQNMLQDSEAEKAGGGLGRFLGAGELATGAMALASGHPMVAAGAGAAYAAQRVGPGIATNLLGGVGRVEGALNPSGAIDSLSGALGAANPNAGRTIQNFTADGLRTVARSLFGSGMEQSVQKAAGIVANSSHPEVDHFILSQQNPAYAKASQEQANGGTPTPPGH